MHQMMKIILTICLSCMLITTVGCSNNTEDKDNNENEATEETKNDETTETSKYPFPNDTTAVGSGKIILSTPSGTSENGDTPVLFVSEDMLIQIGIDAENFDGSKQSFVYVDKVFSNTDQFGELTQTSVNLQDDMLKPGIHTVSVVQFEDDDPNSGSVTSYTEAEYEAKEKK